MKKYFKSLPSGLVLSAMVFGGAVATPSVVAQDYASETPAQREARCSKIKPFKAPEQMGTSFYRKYEKTEEMVAEKRWPDAQRVLDDLLASSKTNDYEKTVLWQAKANIAFEQDNNPNAIRALEKVLTFKRVLRPKQEVQMLINLAMLQNAEDNPTRALELLAQWEPKAYQACATISAAQMAFVSTMHYTQDNFDKSLKYINIAIEMAEADPGIEPRENWYQVAVASHWAKNRYRDALGVLEILVNKFPKRSYWLQMTQAYLELEDERTAYAILDSLYQSGMLNDSSSQLMNVASIYMSRSTPVRAAWLLEEALEQDQLDEKREEQNMTQLGNAWNASREPEKALPYLIRAAALKEDARLWFQIGQVQYSLDQLEPAVLSFNSALEIASGNSSSDKSLRYSLNMQKGNVLASLERFREARNALAEARKTADPGRETRAIANWMRYIAVEEARVEMLTGR